MIAVTVAPSFRLRRDLRAASASGADSRATISPPVGSAVGLGRIPAGGIEQRARGRIDVVAPRRKHPHMRPFAERRADAVAALEDQRAQAARNEMRGRGKADRAGADDGDGKISCASSSFPSF